MSRDLKEIGTAVASDGPSFRVVEVSITTVYGKVCMCQGATRSIERITIAVLAYFESDLDVNLNESPLFSILLILYNNVFISLIFNNRPASIGHISIHVSRVYEPYIFVSSLAGKCQISFTRPNSERVRYFLFHFLFVETSWILANFVR